MTQPTPLGAPPLRRRSAVFVAAGAAVLVVALVAAVTIAAVRSSHPGSGTTVDTSRAVALNRAAPAFVVGPLYDGQAPVDLASYRGKPVVLTFWSAWCHECRTELPQLKALQKAHANEDLTVIGVSYKDIAGDGRRLAKQLGITKWPLGFDDNGSIARAYGVHGIPQTFFIDRKGRVRVHVYQSEPIEKLELNARKILGRG